MVLENAPYLAVRIETQSAWLASVIGGRMMDRGHVIAWLSSLTDQQFAEVFYEAASERATSNSYGECCHFLLAHSSSSPREQRDIVFVALPDPEQYSRNWSDDCPICQTGECAECGARVRSIAKRAICPICEEKVDCT